MTIWIVIRFFNASVLYPLVAIDQCDRSDALDSLHGVTAILWLYSEQGLSDLARSMDSHKLEALICVRTIPSRLLPKGSHRSSYSYCISRSIAILQDMNHNNKS